MLKKTVVFAIASLGAWPCFADDLPALLRDALAQEPSILEAKATADAAAAQVEKSKAQHLPTAGIQVGHELDRNNNNSSPFRGAVGRVNVYAGGAIDAQIERDQFRYRAQDLKIATTRESVAYTVAQYYLQALRAKELMEAEKLNLQRHQKIIDDLTVIVQNDRGREHEKIQAESRALQVNTRLAQYEKSLQLALNRLSRYTAKPVSLVAPNVDGWQAFIETTDKTAAHPNIASQQAETSGAKAELQNTRRSRWPRVDLEAGRGNNDFARVNLTWNFFDPGSGYTVDAATQQLAASEARLDSYQRQIQELSKTALADIEQSQKLITAARDQIAASGRVAQLYEEQYRIARRSLLDVLNAYAELASVEAAKVSAENDYRSAVINYFDAQAAISQWANSTTAAPISGK